MHQAGIENVVSSSGTALTQGQIRLIHRFTGNVTVIYDGDAAGIKAALRGIDLLLEDGINIKVILLPDGEDPDSFARKQNAESLTKYIKDNEVDFIRFKTKLLLDDAGNDPIKRASLITDIVNSISIIPDNIIRTVYIKDCSILLDVDERILVQEVNKKRLAYLEKQPVQKAEPELSVVSNDLPLPATQTMGTVTKKTSIDKFELSILYYIVRYGKNVLVEGNDENDPMTVIDYVKFDLERDGMWFTNPLYTQMLKDAIAHVHEDAFIPNRFFLAHTDPQISRIAAELINDRYQLSKVHIKQFGEEAKHEDTPFAEEKNLIKNVPRVLTELKGAHITRRMEDIKEEMEEKQKAGDLDAAIGLMRQIKELDEIKKALAKILGERIILKW
jgi:DNA primase